MPKVTQVSESPGPLSPSLESFPVSLEMVVDGVASV